MNSTSTDQLSSTFAALADPTRRAILARLPPVEARVKELPEPFPITVLAVAKHLKVLEGAGRAARGRTAQRRPARIRGAALEDIADWLEDCRAFWMESFDRLDERVRRSKE